MTGVRIFELRCHYPLYCTVVQAIATVCLFQACACNWRTCVLEPEVVSVGSICHCRMYFLSFDDTAFLSLVFLILQMLFVHPMHPITTIGQILASQEAANVTHCFLDIRDVAPCARSALIAPPGIMLKQVAVRLAFFLLWFSCRVHHPKISERHSIWMLFHPFICTADAKILCLRQRSYWVSQCGRNINTSLSLKVCIMLSRVSLSAHNCIQVTQYFRY